MNSKQESQAEEQHNVYGPQLIEWIQDEYEAWRDMQEKLLQVKRYKRENIEKMEFNFEQENNVFLAAIAMMKSIVQEMGNSLINGIEMLSRCQKQCVKRKGGDEIFDKICEEFINRKGYSRAVLRTEYYELKKEMEQEKNRKKREEIQDRIDNLILATKDAMDEEIDVILREKGIL